MVVESPMTDRVLTEKKALNRADSFDDWAGILEAHNPEKPPAGINMLRDGAKIIRLQAARIQELEKQVKGLEEDIKRWEIR